ncbi:hypothetical protein EIL40_16730 [Escherichia coli]|nr:hypothetical protein [Escherichia coli]EFN6990608.1 hypothetical protein [Escherichia coli]EFO1882299.1 hypothetical protein [Escherichia coli]
MVFSRVADVLPQPGHGARYYAAVQRVAAFTDTKQNRLAVVEILLNQKSDLGRKSGQKYYFFRISGKERSEG